MARRPSRKVVGERVQALAYRLSDSLLEDEAEAQAAMERQFVAAIPSLRRAVSAAHERGLVVLGADYRSILTQVEALLGRTRPVFRGLIQVAAEKSLDSITAELRLVERALGRKGLAVAAREAAEGSVALRVGLAVRRYDDEIQGAMERFRSAVLLDWRAARGEDLEDVDRRMFSPDPVRLPGHTGKGALWKPYQHVSAACRAQEFLLINDLRRQVMWEFNRLGSADG